MTGRAPDAGRAKKPSLYRHVQVGKPIAVATLVGVVIATLVIAPLSKDAIESVPLLVIALYATLAIAYALFYRLTVTVDERRVRAVFGIGLFTKEVALADIAATEVVRTRLLWGWGIHWTPSGWLYNVGGRQAVRLLLRNERPVMIGSDEPEALAAAIDAARSR